MDIEPQISRVWSSSDSTLTIPRECVLRTEFVLFYLMYIVHVQKGYIEKLTKRKFMSKGNIIEDITCKVCHWGTNMGTVIHVR